MSLTVPRSNAGRCGTQATWRRQASGEQRVSSTPPATIRPSSGRQDAGEARRRCSYRRRSARPVRPSRRAPARGRGARPQARGGPGTRTRRARTAASPCAGPEGARPRDDVGRRLDQVQEPSGDRGAVGAGVELCRQVTEGEVQLRCENEHGQPRLEADASVDEADAHDHRHERHADRRRELEHRAGEKRHAQGRHGRAPVGVADRRRLLDLGTAAVERSERRKAADDVAEVSGEERERLPALLRAALGVPADQPHEDRDERKRQQHDAGRQQIDRGHERQHRDGDDRREHDLGQVAGERRLERLDPRDRDRREPRRSPPPRVGPGGGSACSRPGRAAAARARVRLCAVRRRRTPDRGRPGADDRGQQASKDATWSRGAPSNERATTRAISTACTSTSSAETTRAPCRPPARGERPARASGGGGRTRPRALVRGR